MKKWQEVPGGWSRRLSRGSAISTATDDGLTSAVRSCQYSYLFILQCERHVCCSCL